MVNDFTLNQIGDWVWVYMKEPYQSIEKITNLDIIIGLSTSNTVGSVNVDENTNIISGNNTQFTNLNLSNGDKIIVGDNYLEIDTIDSDSQITLKNNSPITKNNANYYLEPDSDNKFNIQFKYSQNKELYGGNYSELKEINELTNLNFNPDLPLWVKFKFEVDRLGQNNSLTLLSIDYDLQQKDGTVINCPEFSKECDDPWALDGYVNIVADCEPDNLFQPYDLNKPVEMYQQLATIASEMYGHKIQYFRVEPNERSKDVILHEYSLYNVVEQSELKIMIPNNEFPSREFDYDLFGMGFDEFEIHITFNEFNKTFGRGKTPRPRDCLYIPQLNRMYEVFSVNYADEFNLEVTYWKLMLRKYEERTSNQHQNTDTQESMEELVTGMDEVFGEEVEEEFSQTTKPQQYQTIYKKDEDGIRDYFVDSLEIKNEEIRNKWTVIAKNYYDLANVKDSIDSALIYHNYSQLSEDSNLTFVSWIRPQEDLGLNGPEVILEGRNDNKDSGLSISADLNQINIFINNQQYNFTLDQSLIVGRWYGFIININNNDGELNIDIHELDPESNVNKPHKKSNTIYSITNKTQNLNNKVSWNLNNKWRLNKSQIHITNIRLLNKVVKDEKINILQQHVMRDEQNAIIIDNARPSLNLRKYD